MPQRHLIVSNQKRTLDALCAYIDGGHTLHFETVHGEAPTDNRIMFQVEDWGAFVRLLEPEAAAGREV